MNMRKKTLKELEKQFKEDNFFDFICRKWVQGEEILAMSLFKEMRSDDKKDFMNELNYCTFTKKFGDGPWQMEFLQKIIYSINV